MCNANRNSRAQILTTDAKIVTQGSKVLTSDLSCAATPDSANSIMASAASEARSLKNQSRSKATWRAYESDWRQFCDWCSSASVTSLPSTTETVVLFLSSESARGLAPSTLNRRLAAIRLMHIAEDLPSPHNSLEVQEVMRGARNAWGAPAAKKAPAVDGIIKQMVARIDQSTKRGLRDRLVLLLGFAGALRRSELVALNIDDIEFKPKGLLVRIRSSKTDQSGQGQSVAILAQPSSELCPVSALQAWVECSGTNDGAIFKRIYRGDRISDQRLSAQTIKDIVKEAAFKIGLNPDDYAGHSLRRGFLTSAGTNREDMLKILAQSRHKSVDMVREYMDDEDRFDNHAAQNMLQDSTTINAE